MMHTDLGILRAAGISEEQHLFFYLRWKELFDPDTFDSWQVRVSNVRSLLTELEQAAVTTAAVISHRSNVRAILDEMSFVVRDEDPIVRNIPGFRHHVSVLRKTFDDDIATASPPKINHFLRMLNVLRADLSDYTDRLFDRITEIVSSLPRPYKIELNSLCMLLAIDLKNQGFSGEALQESSRRLLSDSEARGFAAAILAMRERLELDFWEQDPGDSVTGLSCKTEARDPSCAARLAHQQPAESPDLGEQQGEAI